MNLFVGGRTGWRFSKDDCGLTAGDQSNLLRIGADGCRISFLTFWLLLFRHRTDSSIHDIHKAQLVTL